MSNDLSVGGLGETQFKLICESAGIVANPSTTDAYGWDFNLEFPNKPINNSMVIDPPLECKVQVKSTRGKSKKVNVKLSNLKRMALYPLPCFFFFIEYNHTTPVNAYLLHLDDEWIEKILRRVTEASHGKNAKPEQLHKITMSVRYDTCLEINLSDPDAIKQKIESFVNGGVEQYVAQKLELLSKLGFEEGAGEVSFNVEGGSQVEKLIDMTLGLDSHVEVSDVIGHFKRFGVNSDVPFIEEAGGTMKIHPNDKGKELIVLFKTHSHDPGVEFTAHLLNSSMNHVVSHEMVKTKIYTEFFDIYIKPYTGYFNLSVNCNSGSSVNIIDIKKVIKLWYILNADQDSVLMQLKVDGKTCSSELKPNTKKDDFSELKKACDTAIRVCDELGVSLDLINTNFSELYYWHERIENMSTLLFGGDSSIDFDKKTSDGEDIPAGKIAVILFNKFALGNRVIGSFFALVGEAKEVDNGRLEMNENKIVRGPVVTACVDELKTGGDLEDLVVGFEERLSKKDMFTVRTF